MTAKSKTEIKAFFQTGDKPTESQFVDLIDSYVDKSGPLGSLEAAASAGGTGLAAFAAGTPSIASYAAARSSMGITVYTTALAVSSVLVSAAISSTMINSGAASSGQTLIADGVGGASWGANSNAWDPVSSTNVTTAVPSVEFTNLVADTTYVVVWEGAKAASTGGHVLGLTVSINNGSSYASSNYQYTNNQSSASGGNPTGGGTTSGSNVPLGGAIGSDANEFGCGHFWFATTDGAWTQWDRKSATITESSFVLDTREGGAFYDGAVNAIKFAFATGNIADGTFTLYEVKKA